MDAERADHYNKNLLECTCIKRQTDQEIIYLLINS